VLSCVEAWLDEADCEAYDPATIQVIMLTDEEYDAIPEDPG